MKPSERINQIELETMKALVGVEYDPLQLQISAIKTYLDEKSNVTFGGSGTKNED